jgi:hypothetical protein
MQCKDICKCLTVEAGVPTFAALQAKAEEWLDLLKAHEFKFQYLSGDFTEVHITLQPGLCHISARFQPAAVYTSWQRCLYNNLSAHTHPMWLMQAMLAGLPGTAVLTVKLMGQSYSKYRQTGEGLT